MAEVCLAANRWGYHGIEISPFTLARSAKDVTSEQSKEVRQIIKDNGLEIVGPTGHGWFSKLIKKWLGTIITVALTLWVPWGSGFWVK